MLGLIPIGLLEPVSWRKTKWIRDTAIIENGIRKCKTRNRFKVGSPTEYPPHTVSTNVPPIMGTAESRLVMTVAAQNDICPHGRTYPRNAVSMDRINRITPEYHVLRFLKEP